MNKHGNQKVKTYSRPRLPIASHREDAGRPRLPIKASASNKQAIHRQPNKQVIESALKKNNILIDIRGEKVCGCPNYCNGCYGRKN